MSKIKENMGVNGGGDGAYNTPKAARKITSKDKNSPTGFESSPNPNMYTKTMKFKIVDPNARINSKDLWNPKKGQPKFDSFSNTKKVYEIKINEPFKEIVGLYINTPEEWDNIKNKLSKLNYTLFGNNEGDGNRLDLSGHNRGMNIKNFPPPSFPFILIKYPNRFFSVVGHPFPDKLKYYVDHYQKWYDSLDDEYFNEIKVNKPNLLQNYKDKAIKGFQILKSEDSNNHENNDEFYDTLIHLISTSNSIENIDKLVFKEFFFGDDSEGFDDWKRDMDDSLNEVRYSKFKKNTAKRTPQEQLHMAVKEIQMQMDNVNKLVEFTSKMKQELKESEENLKYLNRTKNSLAKIQEKIQHISNKIKTIIE